MIAGCVTAADNVPRVAIQLLQGVVASAPTFDGIDLIIEDMISTTSALAGRKSASLIALAVLRAGEDFDNLKSMMSNLADQDEHRLLDQLQLVTTALIVETSTGQRQPATSFFNDIKKGRLQSVNIEHLAVLLRHLIGARAAVAQNRADARSPLVNALLSARAELLALASQLPMAPAVTPNGSVRPRVIAKN